MNSARFALRLLAYLAFHRFRLVLLLAALVFAAMAYDKKSRAVPDWRKYGPTPPKIEVFRSEESIKRTEIINRAVQMLEQKKFQELDALAAELRNSKSMEPDGRWNLSTFYEAVALLPVNTPNFEWEAHLSRLGAWTNAIPNSPTAPVALAYSWVEFAWKARGTGWGNSVSSQMWELFFERVQRAQAILKTVHEDSLACPEYYHVLQRIALAESWDRSEVDKLFVRAVQREPAFTGFYLARANYLLPRWHGAAGEWQSFAAESADKIGGSEGDMLYARIIWFLWNYPIVQQDAFFKQFPETRDRTLKGLAAIHHRYPDSLTFTSQYCRFVGALEYRDLTRHLLEKLNGRVELTVWERESRYVDYYKWAHY
jgi:hypothetical protein